MNETHTTYTYTARNANDPDKVLTFTLDDGHMRVNLTGVIEQANTIASSDEKPEELKHQVALQMKPTLMKLKEQVSGPVHINDVNAKLNDDQFMVTTWPRLGGLRLAPVRFKMGPVDNQDAAEAFVEELHQRQETKSDTRKFFGPLDYWIGWIGLLLLISFLIRKPKTNTS